MDGYADELTHPSKSKIISVRERAKGCFLQGRGRVVSQELGGMDLVFSEIVFRNSFDLVPSMCSHFGSSSRELFDMRVAF